jgi:CRP/FNR family transcriptional regulator
MSIQSKIYEDTASVDLFRGLPEAQISRLAAISTMRSFPKDMEIFSQGDTADGLYAVASGKVLIYQLGPTGKRHILHIFGPGAAFAEVPVFKGGNFPAFAMALENSEVLFFPRDAFRKLLREEPDLSMNMMALLALRLKEFVGKIEALSLKEVPSRLAAHLLLLSETGTGRTVVLDMPMGRLAEYLGTIPETLSRIMKKFIEEGLVLKDGSTLTLQDVERLERLARGEKSA